MSEIKIADLEKRFNNMSPPTDCQWEQLAKDTLLAILRRLESIDSKLGNNQNKTKRVKYCSLDDYYWAKGFQNAHEKRVPGFYPGGLSENEYFEMLAESERLLAQGPTENQIGVMDGVKMNE